MHSIKQLRLSHNTCKFTIHATFYLIKNFQFCLDFINVSGKLQNNVPRVEAGSGKCKVNVVKRELSNYLLYAGGTMGAVARQGRPETRPQGHAHSVIARQC